VFVMTDKNGPEKIDLLRAYGAEVVVCPVAVAPDDPRSYYKVAERLTEERRAFRPNQYANPANPAAHYKTTGPEIWDQTAGRITHFVAGAGTCGSVTGTARYLKEQNPDVRIIAADPEGSVFSGGSGRPYLVEGVGEDFFPAAWEPDLYDEVLAISDADSFAMARHVSRRPGRRGRHPGRPPRRSRRHRRRPQPRHRSRLPLSHLQRRLDGELRLPHRV
jgi:cystathionine beta-synthase